MTTTPKTTASGAADFPEFPAHPEPQTMRWSALEIVAIRRYGADMFRAGRLAASAPVAPTQPTRIERHWCESEQGQPSRMISRAGRDEASAIAAWNRRTPQPVVREPQPMPDLTQLTERGAEAWAGVDAQALREGGASLSANAGEPSEHIKEPYTLAEIKAKIASNDYSAEMLLQHAMLLLDSASLSASAGGEPVAIRPDIQAVLAMLDVPVIARMSSHEGKLLKPGQEPPAFESAVPLVREWDHRRACESIIAALSRNN